MAFGPPARVKSKLVPLPGLVTLATLITPGTTSGMLTPPGTQLHFEGAPGKACTGLVHSWLSPGCRQLRQVLTLTLPAPVRSSQASGRF